MDIPNISLIVATRNRLENIKKFMASLSSLSSNPSWELIIIDNGSTDGTMEWLCSQEYSRLTVLLKEKRIGKSNAINYGISKARGDLLVFTDDDIVPEEHWLIALYKAFVRNPMIDVFGGRVLVDEKKVPKWIIKSNNLQEILLSKHNLGAFEQIYPINRYPIGPNMAVRRVSLTCLQKMWSTKYGPGTSIPVGDEKAFLIKLSMPIEENRLYVPEAVVYHLPEIDELSLVKCVKRCFLGGYAAGQIDSNSVRRIGQVDKVLRKMKYRLLYFSSINELVCDLARALGVLAGKLIGKLNKLGWVI